MTTIDKPVAYLDLEDPDIMHAYLLGYQSWQSFIDTHPLPLFDTDDLYKNFYLAAALSALEDGSLNTAERRLVAIYCLASPALETLSPAERADQFGNAISSLTAEIGQPEWLGDDLSHKKAYMSLTPLAKRTIHIMRSAHSEYEGWIEGITGKAIKDMPPFTPGQHVLDIQRTLKQPKQYDWERIRTELTEIARHSSHFKPLGLK